MNRYDREEHITPMINDILAGVTAATGVTTLLHNIAELIRQNRDSPLRLEALSQHLRNAAEPVREALAGPAPLMSAAGRDPAVTARRIERDAKQKE